MRYPTTFFFILFILILIIPFSGNAQNDAEFELVSQVNRVYPPVVVTQKKLNNAKTLTDLNKRYEASWVSEYKLVEISTTQKGNTKKAIGKDDVLNQEQKNLLQEADTGTEVTVRVEYIPENNLKHNDAKEMDFAFTVDPDIEAQFIGGEELMEKFLKENVIDKVSFDNFKKYQLAAYKFTINETGQVINQHVFSSSDDEQLDELMLATICSMPTWKAAEYDDGTKVSQEFVLSVGDMRSCVVNLLSINQ